MFHPNFDDRAEWEAEQRGTIFDVKVRIDCDKTYTVTFVTPERLKSDLELAEREGRYWIAEAGLVVVSKVTRRVLQNVVEQILKAGFFDGLVPDL